MANQLCHFELITDDPKKCKEFYGAVFDWQFDDESMKGYTLIQTGVDPPGGILQKRPDVPGACVNTYFRVDDIPAILEKAKANGAKILVEQTPIPGVGQLAVFADPEGIVVGIMQEAE